MAKREDRELTDAEVVHAAARDSIKLLTEMNKHQDIPMKEFTKVLMWEADQAKLLWRAELEHDQRTGSKFEDRKYCGVPYEEFEIKSLGIYKSNI